MSISAGTKFWRLSEVLRYRYVTVLNSQKKGMYVLLRYTSKSPNKQFLVHFRKLVFDFHLFELRHSLRESGLAVIRGIQAVVKMSEFEVPVGLLSSLCFTLLPLSRIRGQRLDPNPTAVTVNSFVCGQTLFATVVLGQAGAPWKKQMITAPLERGLHIYLCTRHFA